MEQLEECPSSTPKRKRDVYEEKIDNEVDNSGEEENEEEDEEDAEIDSPQRNEIPENSSNTLSSVDAKKPKKTPKLSINDKVKLIFLHRNESKSYGELSKLFHCSKSTICGIMKKQNQILEAAKRLSKLFLLVILGNTIFMS